MKNVFKIFLFIVPLFACNVSHGMWLVGKLFGTSEVQTPPERDIEEFNRARDIVIKLSQERGRTILRRAVKDMYDPNRWKLAINEENEEVCIKIERLAGTGDSLTPWDHKWGLIGIKLGNTTLTLKHFSGDELVEVQKINVTVER